MLLGVDLQHADAITQQIQVLQGGLFSGYNYPYQIEV